MTSFNNIPLPEKIYVLIHNKKYISNEWRDAPPDCNDWVNNFATYTRNGVPAPYVRELEEELLAMKAKMTTLALKADELVMELTGVDSPEDDALVDTALPVSVNLVVYELMELAHSALAANEAQS